MKSFSEQNPFSEPMTPAVLDMDNFSADLLVNHIARALVDQPQSVTVNQINGDNIEVLELRVAKEDLGKIIGKQGRTAQAIRTLLSAVSSKNRKRAVLEIIE